MRFLAAALWVLLSLPAFGQSVEPSFQDFESACRLGSEMNPECLEGVYFTFYEMTGRNEGNCDGTEFWRIRDTLDVLPDLPWEEAVEIVLSAGHACV